MSATTDSYLPTVLAYAGPRLHVPRGWPLAFQGDRSTTAYVVLSGTLKVTRDGQEIGRINPGELAGELGLLRGEPRNATMIALTPVEVIAMDEASFDMHRRTVPALRAALERTHSLR
ncbi:MAG TPA: cyclic nucleotide-binding domain-containing protein [Euzebya sp.]|nr:cyclic nucleotide-binding domain-containing protein [Euzebya sp.]